MLPRHRHSSPAAQPEGFVGVSGGSEVERQHHSEEVVCHAGSCAVRPVWHQRAGGGAGGTGLALTPPRSCHPLLPPRPLPEDQPAHHTCSQPAGEGCSTTELSRPWPCCAGVEARGGGPASLQRARSPLPQPLSGRDPSPSPVAVPLAKEKPQAADGRNRRAGLSAGVEQTALLPALGGGGPGPAPAGCPPKPAPSSRTPDPQPSAHSPIQRPSSAPSPPSSPRLAKLFLLSPQQTHASTLPAPLCVRGGPG